MTAGRAMIWYVTAMAGLIIGYFVVPGFNIASTALIGLCGGAALLIGRRIHRARRGFSWDLIAAGVLAFAAGDVAYLLTGEPGGVADLGYLLMIPLVGAGLLGLTRASARARDRANLLDLLIVGTAAATLCWVTLIHPYLLPPGPFHPETSMLAVYALADLLVLGATVRLLVTARRNIAALLLTVGASGMLVADLLYGVAVLGGNWRDGGPVELGWFSCYLAWGAAALHPSMAALTEPAEPRQTEIRPHRLVLLAVAVTVAPAVLLYEAASGPYHDAAVVAVASGVTFVLVISRLADAMDGHRSAIDRERGLRRAGTALVAATEAATVGTAVRVGVSQLMTAEQPHRTLLVVNRADGVPAPAMSIWGPTISAPLTGYAPPSVASARRARLLRVANLHPALAAELRGFDTVVLCPLVLDERVSGVPRVGALLVAAAEPVLVTIRESLEVLAAQTALALERIGLSQEINRRDSEEYFRSLVRNATDVILIVDGDRRVRYASPSAAAVLGVEPAAGSEVGAAVHPDDRPAVDKLFTYLPRHPDEWHTCSVRRTDGARIQLEISCHDLRDDPAVHGLVITMRDVTERQRLLRELTWHAGHDPLTGLVNRAFLADRTHEAVRRARAGGRTAGAVRLDVDEFTAVNDTHGRAVGDAWLRAIGQRLTDLVGGNGTVARLDGDEFAVLVSDADSPEQVEGLANQLRDSLAEPFTIAGTVLSGSVSVGVATTGDAGNAGELLDHAGLALYVAKADGTGRCRRYQPALHAAIVQRLELRTALAQAVDELSFTVEYQPIVDLANGSAAGFEALVRWRHPTLGPVPPQQFIALAEETGLIGPIGDWVLARAISDAGRWRRDTRAPAPYVSVNVSVDQLRTPGFVAKVRAALAAAEVPPSAIMLEITESVLLGDGEPVWAELTELRSLGLRVAIDDFGTGFSALSYLHRIPADVLKIDRSFVVTVATDHRQRLLVEGIVRLADTLGLEIVAEGVETEAVRGLLREVGCRYGQGFLFARPLREAEVDPWLTGQPPGQSPAAVGAGG